MTPYQQTARGIIAAARSLTPSALADDELAALARLLVCIYMNSYMDGGALHEDPAYAEQLRTVAAALRDRHAAAPSPAMATALDDLMRTGEVEAPSSEPSSALCPFGQAIANSQPSAAEFCPSGQATANSRQSAAEAFRAEYLARVCSPGYVPTEADAAHFLAQCEALQPAATALADRLALHYVLYSVMADMEDLGV